MENRVIELSKDEVNKEIEKLCLELGDDQEDILKRVRSGDFDDWAISSQIKLLLLLRNEFVEESLDI